MRRIGKTPIVPLAAALALGAAPAAFAQFDTLTTWGNAGNGTNENLTSTGSITILTASGADWWGNADSSAFASNSGGAHTTTGDFTATVRNVAILNPAPEWGRHGIDARGGADPLVAGAPSFGSVRKSNGAMVTQWRDTLDGGMGRDDAAFPQYSTGNVATTPTFLASARDGNTMRSANAIDLGAFGGAPTPGRWIQHATHSADAFNGGNALTVGINHNSHPQSGGGSLNGGFNTAIYDNWNFNESYDASKFGTPAPDYAVGGGINGLVDGAIIPQTLTGSAYTFENGAATGEATGWRVTAQRLSDLPVFGIAGARNETTAITDFNANLVPASAFRQPGGGPAGLVADIYLAGNPGSLAGARGIIDGNAANGTTVIPDVWWGNPGVPANGYPDNIPGANDQGGANTTNLFHQAVLANDGAATAFSPAENGGNQENYGVHLQGEIFIPSDADRGGREWLSFKDGVDDFTFLAVDGVELINDNSWTGNETNQNAGGAVSAFDTSDIKFDDGEWVSFEMIGWEGGGGDPMSLYWDVDGSGEINEDILPRQVESTITLQGNFQIGSDTADGVFGALPEGHWDQVTLEVANTRAGLTATASDVTVIPEPGAVSLIALFGALGILRRRRRA